MDLSYKLSSFSFSFLLLFFFWGGGQKGALFCVLFGVKFKSQHLVGGSSKGLGGDVANMMM